MKIESLNRDKLELGILQLRRLVICKLERATVLMPSTHGSAAYYCAFFNLGLGIRKRLAFMQDHAQLVNPSSAQSSSV